MGTYQYIVLGLQVALQPVNLLFCFLGVLVGTLVGVLPGLGPAAAMALILPATFYVRPDSAIIMLAGIYYGAMYGGSTTSILVNVPGEPSSVVTCIDGYKMARQGRAGAALGISAFGSFIAGTLGVVALMLIANPMAKFVLKFGPPEYFALMILGLSLLVYLSIGSKVKALAMACLGLILSFIGVDVLTGVQRFIFGHMELADGLGLVPVLMGIFGISEILINLEGGLDREIYETKIKGLLPNREDWSNSIIPIFRGTSIGFLTGLLPGGGPTIASFAAYAVEKKISKHPERFGTGIIEGVAAPESANNSSTAAGFIPLFIIGIPANGILALLFGALIIHGLTPGPLLLTQNPKVFWGTIISMYIGNLMLLLLNLPLIGIWVRIIRIPYSILSPIILFFCLIGAYTLNNSALDVTVMLVFGGIGYVMRKFDFEGAPLILAFVLGPMIEKNFLQSLMISGGSYKVFWGSFISAITLSLALVVIVSSVVGFLREKPQESKLSTP
jgi:putative tricarboxylic transport membrane protein